MDEGHRVADLSSCQVHDQGKNHEQLDDGQINNGSEGVKIVNSLYLAVSANTKPSLQFLNSPIWKMIALERSGTR